MRQNPHVRICGGPGSATTLVYPTSRRSCGVDWPDRTETGYSVAPLNGAVVLLVLCRGPMRLPGAILAHPAALPMESTDQWLDRRSRRTRST